MAHRLAAVLRMRAPDRRLAVDGTDYAKEIGKKYGVSAEEYNDLLAKQGYVCAICGTDPGGRRLAVDHDHATGVVRGLLCSPCNTGIGNLRDDVALLASAIKYLASNWRKSLISYQE